MERFLCAELARLKRYGGDLAVAFIDLDQFKRVNDTFGHDYGDALLQYLADGLRKMSRQSDLATRLAGDEFILILPQTSKAKASELLKRIEMEFTSRPLTFRGEVLEIKISYGIASSDEHLDYSELLRLADRRLYESKRGKQAV
jgi:diguanylate cyclase (GGDEF)-like protein